MTNSGGDDEDWGEGSGDEEEREEGDDDLIEVDPEGSTSIRGHGNNLQT